MPTSSPFGVPLPAGGCGFAALRFSSVSRCIPFRSYVRLQDIIPRGLDDIGEAMLLERHAKKLEELPHCLPSKLRQSAAPPSGRQWPPAAGTCWSVARNMIKKGGRR